VKPRRSAFGKGEVESSILSRSTSLTSTENALEKRDVVRPARCRAPIVRASACAFGLDRGDRSPVDATSPASLFHLSFRWVICSLLRVVAKEAQLIFQYMI
jgi:hypothetical protein